jgi:hypothetical protein
MSKKVIENLKKEIQSLMNKDFDLRKSIEKLEKDLNIDDVQFKKLKKEKLKIKDEILSKKDKLIPLLNKSLLDMFLVDN